MAVSKVPPCPSGIETPKKIFLKAYLSIAEKWHILRPGTAEQRKTENRNTKSGTVKPGYGIPNPGQTVLSASLTRINQDKLTALVNKRV